MKGVVHLQGVHRLAGETGCVGGAGFTAGSALWAWAIGSWMARKRWGNLRESLVLQKWVRFVGKGVSRTEDNKGWRSRESPVMVGSGHGLKAVGGARYQDSSLELYGRDQDTLAMTERKETFNLGDSSRSWNL